MPDKISPPTHAELEPVDWRQFFRLDAQSAAVIFGCVLFLVGFLAVLPRWLHGREAADFAGAALQTAPGRVTALQISPVSTGGGSLFNAVNLAFAGHAAYYALPPESRWKPRSGQPVTVRFQVGRRSGRVQIRSVTPD